MRNTPERSAWSDIRRFQSSVGSRGETAPGDPARRSTGDAENTVGITPVLVDRRKDIDQAAPRRTHHGQPEDDISVSA
jgi:hypothetical protein